MSTTSTTSVNATYTASDKAVILQNFSALGWPHTGSYGLTPGGAQYCLLDGAIENSSAATDRRGQLLDHWAHCAEAHVSDMFTRRTSSTNAAPAAS